MNNVKDPVTGVERPPTKGEYRVGITFNPSGSEIVNKLKRLAADLIDAVEEIPLPADGMVRSEAGRLKSIAQTEIETAAMYAVKAATKN